MFLKTNSFTSFNDRVDFILILKYRIALVGKQREQKKNFNKLTNFLDPVITLFCPYCFYINP